MKIRTADLKVDLPKIKQIAEAAFSTTPDASLTEWFSFTEMEKEIERGRGLCLIADDEAGGELGIIYAQQESPINGKESVEKWVIILAAVIPEASGKGVGTKLLEGLESELIHRNIKKLFVFTNEDDDRVIGFYRKNGYQDAGWIKDYQYGKGNTAVFLLKHLETS